MRDPVRGEFKVTGRYYAHPHSSSFREVLTGVVTVPGMPPTPGEHLSDMAGRWAGRDVLPVMADRTDPARFVILWDEVPKSDWRTDARRQAAQEAEQMRSAAPAGAAAQAAGPVLDSTQVPDWAREMLTSLGGQMPPGTVAGYPVTINAGTEIIDLNAGHLSAADAEWLSAAGEPATAVLTGIAEVPLPQAALPGPTASLCDLTLEVTRRDGHAYHARTRVGFRDAQRRAAITVPGIVLPVRIDSADPSRVAIDISAFDAQHPSS